MGDDPFDRKNTPRYPPKPTNYAAQLEAFYDRKGNLNLPSTRETTQSPPEKLRFVNAFADDGPGPEGMMFTIGTLYGLGAISGALLGAASALNGFRKSPAPLYLRIVINSFLNQSGRNAARFANSFASIAFLYNGSFVTYNVLREGFGYHTPNYGVRVPPMLDPADVVVPTVATSVLLAAYRGGTRLIAKAFFGGIALGTAMWQILKRDQMIIREAMIDHFGMRSLMDDVRVRPRMREDDPDPPLTPDEIEMKKLGIWDESEDEDVWEMDDENDLSWEDIAPWVGKPPC